MPQIKVIYETIQSTGEMTGTTNSTAVSLDGALTYSAQLSVTVDTPGAKTFASTAVDTTADTATITAHGYTTGLKGQLTTTGGLPAGLSLSTDYFIIVVDANTVQFASSLANALAGTFIDLTTQGTGNDTFTPTAIAGGTAILQMSSDSLNITPTNWNDEGSSQNITATGVLVFKKVNPEGNWMRVKFTITAGRMISANTILVKGPN